MIIAQCIQTANDDETMPLPEEAENNNGGGRWKRTEPAHKK